MKVATGGGDGGLVLWPSVFLVGNRPCTTLVSFSLLNKTLEYVKCVRLINNLHVLAVTDFGSIWLFGIKGKCWNLWFRGDKEFVATELNIGRGNNFVAAGSSSGDCIIFKYEINSSEPKIIGSHRWKLYNSKILSLIWVDEKIVTVGPEGIADLWQTIDKEDGLSVRKLLRFILPPCRQRWLASATISHDSLNLICGSRDGSIHIFPLDAQMDVLPVQSILRVHGKQGVTCLCCRRDSIISAGRDGFIRFFKKYNSTYEQMRSFRVSGCPEWIADLKWTAHDKLLVLGFHNDRFVIWDDELQCLLLDIVCGGGHRSWDLGFDDEWETATFVYVKERKIVVSSNEMFKAKPCEIMLGLHAKEINVIKHLHTFPDGKMLCATGSEDTTVKIFTVQERLGCYDLKMTMICTLQHHISSVKSLHVSKLKCDAASDDGEKGKLILFGAGGRAQLSSWIVHLPSHSDEEIECEFVCTQLLHSSNFRCAKPWRKLKLSSEPEARYMDIATWESSDGFKVSVVCSDGWLRLFNLNITSRNIQLLKTFVYSECCLLTVRRFDIDICPRLIATTATDGHVAFWSIDQLEKVCLIEGEGKSDTSQAIVFDLKLHQSGIDAIAFKRFEGNGEEYFLATGGDDGCICILRLKITLEPDGKLSFSVLWKKSLASAHAAQIEGIHFIDCDRLVSISIDQRLITWDRDLNEVSCKCFDVADAQSSAMWTDRSVHLNYIPFFLLVLNFQKGSFL